MTKTSSSRIKAQDCRQWRRTNFAFVILLIVGGAIVTLSIYMFSIGNDRSASAVGTFIGFLISGIALVVAAISCWICRFVGKNCND